MDTTRYESFAYRPTYWRARNFGIGCGEKPISKIFEAVQAFGGNTEAQDDRTLVVLERIK